MLAPFIDEVITDLKTQDPQSTQAHDLQATIEVLEKYEIIQNFELNEFEKESTFSCQFFLRVLHEVGIIDMRKNHVHFDQDEFERSRAANREQMDNSGDDDDQLFDRTVAVEEVPEYYITDVNDLVYPISKGSKKVFSKGYTYEKEKVLFFG
jgi:hypothetical protein